MTGETVYYTPQSLSDDQLVADWKLVASSWKELVGLTNFSVERNEEVSDKEQTLLAAGRLIITTMRERSLCAHCKGHDLSAYIDAMDITQHAENECGDGQHMVDGDCVERTEMSEEGEFTVSSVVTAALNAKIKGGAKREDVVAAIAKAAGIIPATVNNILNGDIKCPPIDRVKKIAQSLGISAESITGAGGCNYDDDKPASAEMGHDTDLPDEAPCPKGKTLNADGECVDVETVPGNSDFTTILIPKDMMFTITTNADSTNVD